MVRLNVTDAMIRILEQYHNRRYGKVIRAKVFINDYNNVHMVFRSIGIGFRDGKKYHRHFAGVFCYQNSFSYCYDIVVCNDIEKAKITYSYLNEKYVIEKRNQHDVFVN